MAVRGLGHDFDICHVVAPVADVEVALTGANIHMKNYGGIAICAYYAAVSAGTDTAVVDIQQANAFTSGTVKDLDVVTEFWIKSEATLDGDEAWVRTTQAAASEISLTGATYAATQLMLVCQIDADDLDVANGFEWVSIAQADPGSGGTRPGCVFAIPYGLKVQRAPENLAVPSA
jgi:hypothetical protein